jgi:hypothetical protein
LPRAFSVERVKQHGSDDDVLTNLTKASPIDLMHAAHVLDADAPSLSGELSPASLRLTNYRAGEIEFDTTASGEAVIVVADTWIPGWKVYVDGQEIRPFRVNHTQIGIHLPKSGMFRIRLAYEPPYRRFYEILSAPTRLIVAADPSEPFIRQLGSRSLPPICASTIARE